MATKHLRNLLTQSLNESESKEQRFVHDFRPIHYLGSKLRMLDTIQEIVDEIAPNGEPICDLFSGSGSVSRRLAHHRPVTSVDIQEYSRVICSALLHPVHIPLSEQFLKRFKESDYCDSMANAIEPVAVYEEKCLKKALKGDTNPLCEFLEEGSLIRSQHGDNSGCSVELGRVLRETLIRVQGLDIPEISQPRMTLYFGGVYFSYLQAAAIDTILHEIFHSPLEYRNTLLAATLSTVSDVVNTVGKQFAQPLRPRTSDGLPKKNLARMVMRDRVINVLKTFEVWLEMYNNLENTGFQHSVYKMDYANAFDCIDPDLRVVYADPPYTRDHYSRFYHVLETICLRDSPEISTTKIGGKVHLSRGLYRLERHQSPFCVKSQAPKAFDVLFARTARHGAALVLSYSPYNQGIKARPRVMTIEDLIELASRYFTKVSKICPGSFSHSKLNRRDRNFSIKDFGETLIVCQNA